MRQLVEDVQDGLMKQLDNPEQKELLWKAFGGNQEDLATEANRKFL